eukprot:gene45029-56052_t
MVRGRCRGYEAMTAANTAFPSQTADDPDLLAPFT